MLAGMTRRQLLKIAWTLGVAAIARPLTVSRVWAKPVFDRYPFPLGVASGDPLPDGIVLWTRLAPHPLDGGGMPMANVEVEWELSATRAFTTIAQKGTTIARPELGHSVHVDVSGLEPGREYWYRFRAGDEVSQVGRTRTAPPAGQSADRLRFAVCGCSHYENGHFTAYRRLAEESFDFVFHSGDYIYEGRGDGGRNDALPRQHRGEEIFTLVDYRNRYAQYKLDPDLKAAHASAPFIVSFDDHEVANNVAGIADARNTPPEVFLLRRAAAYQAYYETMPLRAASTPRGPDIRIYRRLQFGSLIDFHVLDTRQFRSDQACGDGLRTNCQEALDPKRTMLGSEQEKWLFDSLGSSRARWTVLGQQVPMMMQDFGKSTPNGRFNMDKWDGYVAARNRVFDTLRGHAALNAIVLSGDVHAHWGADLKLDFANPDSRTVGVELTNSSITSGGDGSDVREAWPVIRNDNPHIKYHSNRRGYIACTVTPSTWRAEFKILDKVTEPGHPARTGGTLTVEAGRAGVSG
jgi:alkaline phosphatase D